MRKTKKITKTTVSRTKRKRPLHQGKGYKDAANDEVLAVLVDDKRGREYYVSMIDSFRLGERMYAVMYNFEPDIGTHPEPELVIMRVYLDQSGEQIFVSIRNRKELDEAFDVFFNRYEKSL